MKNKINPFQLELGYSPNNLRYLRHSFGLTQKKLQRLRAEKTIRPWDGGRLPLTA